MSNPSELVTYWRDMAKAWEEQATRNALLLAELEQELKATRQLMKVYQDEVCRLERRKRRAA